jgi:hypothetical protein
VSSSNEMRRRALARRFSVLFCAASAFTAARAPGATDTATWDNANSSWSVAGHWTHSSGGAAGLFPNNGNGGFTFDVVINSGNVTQDLASGMTIDGLAFNGGVIDGPNQITVNFVGNWVGGTMSGAGTTIFGASSTLNITGSSKGLNRTLVNNGIATWTGTRIDVTGGTFNNNAGASFDAQADTGFTNFGGSNAFNNAGTFTRTAGIGTATFGIAFNNSGTVTVSSGTVSLDGGGVSSGTFTAATGSALRFGGGSQALTGAQISGAGTIGFGGGTTTLDSSTVYNVIGTTAVSGGTANFGNNASTNRLDFTSGTIGGTGTLNVSGVATWSGGSMGDTGTTVFGASSTFSIEGGTKALSRTIVNNGVAVWTGTRIDVTGGTFNNNAGASFDARADTGFTNFGGANAFSNAGTFTRTVGTGTATFGVAFNNSGTVSVSSGTLSLDAGGASSGTFSAATGSTVRFGGGTHVMTGAKFNGGGTIEFGGGTTTLDSASVYNVIGTTSVSGGTASFSNNASTNRLNFTGGTIGGAGVLSISGVATWSGGAMLDVGSTSFAASSVLSIEGGTKALSRTIVNNGVAVWTGARIDITGGTFNNSVGATFDAQANTNFESFGGVNAFNNAGTVTRTVGVGAAGINIPFNNTGTVSISSGTLSLNTGGVSSGTFTVNTGSALRFGGGTQVITAANVSAAGTIEFSGGTTNFNSTSVYNVAGTTTVSGGTANFSDNATSNRLNLTGGSIGGAGTLTVSGVATWSGGAMGDTGTTIFGAASSLSIEGGSKGLNRLLVNNGAATWAGTRIDIVGGTFNNNAGASFNAQADTNFESFGGANAFNNAGLFTRTVGTGAPAMNLPFNNTGTVSVSSGTLSLNVGGASSGTFTAAAGSTLRFGGGTHAMTGANVSGTGTIEFSGGTTNFNSASVYSVASTTTLSGGTANFGNNATTNRLNLISGTIGGAGTLTVSGVATWSGGTMQDVGTTVFAAGSTLSIEGGSKGMNRVINNNGAATWAGTRIDISGGTFNNNASASFDARADTNFESFGGVNAFNNAGLFTRTVGVGAPGMNLPFNNTGTVSVSSGTLSLNGGGASSGTFAANAGSALRFGGGTQQMTAARVSGAGTIEFSGGATNFNTVSVYNVAGTTTLSGGTASFDNNASTNQLNFVSGAIGGAGTLTVSGVATWSGGTMLSTGTIVFAAGSTLSIEGGSKGLNRVLINNGAATWAGTRIDISGGTFNNNAGATFDAQANTNFESFGGASAFNNSGTVTRTVSTGAAGMNLPFNNNGTVSVSTGTLGLNAGGVSTGTFIAGSTGALRFGGGTHTLGATSRITGAGTANFAAGLTVIGGTYDVAVTAMNSGAVLRLASGTNRVLRTGVLNFDGTTNSWGGQVDLTDGDAIIDYTSPAPNPYANIRNQIKQGFSGGSWTGGGITTSLGDGHHALGYADNATFGRATFSGQTVDATSILIKFTYPGDTNLDGQVDVTDLGSLATNWQTSGDWVKGDFNYDGFVDVSDLGALATNWQAGVGNPLAPSRLDEALAAVGLGGVSVPEPSGLGIVVAGILFGLRKRR